MYLTRPENSSYKATEKSKKIHFIYAANGDYFYIPLLPLFLNKWISVIAYLTEGLFNIIFLTT